MTRSINIEVTIAQELRDLIAARGGVGLKGRQVPPVNAVEQNVPLSAKKARDPAPEYTSIWVRRDGRRPRHFKGIRVVSFTGDVAVGGLECTQEMTLYQTATKRHYLALALHLPSASAIRPIYDCYSLLPGTAADVLQRWFARIAAQVRLPSRPDCKTDTFTNHLPAFAAGFHALTAHCLLTEQMPAERNDLCLQ